MIVNFIAICIFLTFTSGQDLQCFVPGECTDGLHLDSTTAENEVFLKQLRIKLYNDQFLKQWNSCSKNVDFFHFSCPDNCKANGDCTWFTYYPGNKLFFSKICCSFLVFLPGQLQSQ